MYEEWKILYIDEDEEESRAFCRALEANQYAGKCDTVRSIAEGRNWLDESLYTPRSRARPDVVVLNWHADRSDEVLDFVRWMRAQPQFRETPLAVLVGKETPAIVRERVAAAGVNELMHKPNAFDDLVKQTGDLLQRCVSHCLAR
jgi:CheY-like chemotaxis protein